MHECTHAHAHAHNSVGCRKVVAKRDYNNYPKPHFPAEIPDARPDQQPIFPGLQTGGPRQQHSE